MSSGPTSRPGQDARGGPAAQSTLVSRIDEGARTLSPMYFALVMATGVVSMGLQLEGRRVLSAVLFAITGLAFVVLIVLSVWRLIRHTAAFVADLRNPSSGFGFFTFVAGTNVLAARVFDEQWYALAVVLLILSCASWFLLGYIVPWMVVLGRARHPVLPQANGSWFIWVVASQSLAVVAATLEPAADGARDTLAALAVLGWAVGLFLYGAVGVLVALRMLLYDLRAADLGPAYWITMGAAAITVLAGSKIVEMAASPAADAVRQLVSGISVVFWAFATWLIPVLVAVDWWRHVRRRIRLRYEPGLWGLVFPLGMYAVAGIYLGRADRLPLAVGIGQVELWVAVAVWLATMIAMVVRMLARLTGPGPDRSRGQAPREARP